jgi:hypothetical protein
MESLRWYSSMALGSFSIGAIRSAGVIVIDFGTRSWKSGKETTHLVITSIAVMSWWARGSVSG